jgi:N-acetyl sugar amidotransferase
MKKIKWCTNCLAMSTRPRISFDEEGLCNACRWMEAKKSIDWVKRENELVSLLNKYRKNDGSYDCLVPCSGGKDGSYVAYTLKHKYGMNPLAVTVTPALPLELGDKNLKSFVESGYNHISINACSGAMKKLNKIGFQEMGFPYYGWLIAIPTATIKTALSYDISLIFYGEDGEVEYGGSNETINNPIFNIDYIKRVYLEGGYDKVLDKSNLSENDLYFFRFPKDKDLENKELNLTHLSYFENWDPYRNYLVAKEHCGLQEAETTNEGTFTNFSQNDQALYALHTYLMYLKFGFGRANQDASIEVRRGSMDRNQALNLVKIYDGIFPENYLNIYLDYFEMSIDEFYTVLDRYANKDLFEKIDGIWSPKFIPGEDFVI